MYQKNVTEIHIEKSDNFYKHFLTKTGKKTSKTK